VSFGAEYAARRDGQVIGLAFNASSAGFNDTLSALVGISADGTVAGIRITQLSDTPGLGAYASSDNYLVDKASGVSFYGQFAGKRASANFAVRKDGGDIIAITAATITSRAVSLLVAAAAKAGSAALDTSGGGR
jgi:electron transport complex protein RnfG